MEIFCFFLGTQLKVISLTPCEDDILLSTFFKFLKKFYLFLERGEGREKERERNINVWLPFTLPRLGTWLAIQTCDLTGNRTSDLSIHRPALNPLNHSSQRTTLYFLFLQVPQVESKSARQGLYLGFFFFNIFPVVNRIFGIQ